QQLGDRQGRRALACRNLLLKLADAPPELRVAIEGGQQLLMQEIVHPAGCLRPPPRGECARCGHPILVLDDLGPQLVQTAIGLRRDRHDRRDPIGRARPQDREGPWMVASAFMAGPRLSPSALVMAIISAISMMPRLMPCSSSPAPASSSTRKK